MSDADVPPASPFERDWKNLTSQQQAMFRKVVLEAFVPDLMAPAARLGRGGIRHSGGTMSRMGTSPQARDPDVQVAIISGVATDPEGFGHLVKSALIYGDRITITDPAMLALVFAVQFRDGDLDQLPPPLRRAAERAAKVDLGFLVAAREQNLLELNMFMNSTTLAQGSGLDAYWKAIAERLTQKDTYALFDETGGRVFADAIRRGIFSLERPVRRRARQPSATAGFLAKLPNFRPANIEDVLGIREELQGALSRFRAAISALTREFEHDPTEWEFFDDVGWRRCRFGQGR